MLLSRILYYLGCLSIAAISVRPLFQTTLSDWLFISALVVTIPALLTNPKGIPYRIPKSTYIGTLLFLLSATFTLFWIDDPEVVAHSSLVIAKFSYLGLIWLWLGTLVFTNISQIRLASLCVAISTAISTVFELYQRSIISTQDWERANGLAEHTNQFGATSAIGVSIIFVYIFGGKIKSTADWVRLTILLMLMALCGAGLFLSKSIGSFFAVFVATIAWLIIKRLKPIYILSTALVAAITIGLLYHQQQVQDFSILERIHQNSSVGNDKSTLKSRIDTYSIAIDMILDNPLVGKGIDVATSTGYAVHNSILKAIYETGIIGGVGIGMVFFSIFSVTLNNLRRKINHEYRTVTESLFMAFITFFIVSLKEPIFYTRFGWITAGLLLAIFALPKETHSTRSTRPRT